MYIHPLERGEKNVTGGCVNFYINSTIFNALAQAFYNDKLKYILKEIDSDCTVQNSSTCPYFFLQSPLHTGNRTVETEEKKAFPGMPYMDISFRNMGRCVLLYLHI